MFRSASAIVRRALRIFSSRDARFLGAAIAFYALLSAAPLFLVVLRLVGGVFGRARAEDALWHGLGQWLAPEGVRAMRSLTERMDRLQARGGVVGVALVVYGSMRLFLAMRRALNHLWGVDTDAVERRQSTPVRLGLRYGGAAALALFVALLVAVLVVVKTAFAVVVTLGTRPPPSLLWIADVLTSVGLTFLLFTVVFRFLPDVRITLREAALSSAGSTFLFAVGSGLVTLYLRKRQVGDLYAGASAVVLSLLWVYYSAQVFFFGACIGRVLHGERRR